MSPFFDNTSNNYVVFQQGMSNANMLQYLNTREMFEGRLKSMSGLEFIVAQEPAETGPGAGTGVWVINKQTRKKRPGEEDEVIVHSTYFMVGENIYMAPTLQDIISSRIASISSSVSKFLPIADSVQTWSPAKGRAYQNPATQLPTPTPQAKATSNTTASKSAQQKSNSVPEAFLLEAIDVQERYGGEYMDENPISGKPGDFILSSTGRKEKVPLSKAPGPLALKDAALPILNTKVADNPLAKNAKDSTKSPKTPNSAAKPKKKKTKTGQTPTAS